jgi:hypothetical protein
MTLYLGYISHLLVDQRYAMDSFLNKKKMGLPVRSKVECRQRNTSGGVDCLVTAQVTIGL